MFLVNEAVDHPTLLAAGQFWLVFKNELQVPVGLISGVKRIEIVADDAIKHEAVMCLLHGVRVLRQSFKRSDLGEINRSGDHGSQDSGRQAVPRASETPDVYFYVPSRELVAEVPCAIEDYWGWIDQAAHATPAPLPPGSSYAGKKCTWLGPYNWTLQTFIRLREHGFPCHLTHTIPPAGIVITHSDFLPRFLRPTRQQFFVEIKPDRLLNCRFANFVIVQNRHDPIRSGIARWLIEFGLRILLAAAGPRIQERRSWRSL